MFKKYQKYSMFSLDKLINIETEFLEHENKIVFFDDENDFIENYELYNGQYIPKKFSNLINDENYLNYEDDDYPMDSQDNFERESHHQSFMNEDNSSHHEMILPDYIARYEDVANAKDELGYEINVVQKELAQINNYLGTIFPKDGVTKNFESIENQATPKSKRSQRSAKKELDMIADRQSYNTLRKQNSDHQTPNYQLDYDSSNYNQELSNDEIRNESRDEHESQNYVPNMHQSLFNDSDYQSPSNAGELNDRNNQENKSQLVSRSQDLPYDNPKYDDNDLTSPNQAELNSYYPNKNYQSTNNKSDDASYLNPKYNDPIENNDHKTQIKEFNHDSENILNNDQDNPDSENKIINLIDGLEKVHKDDTTYNSQSHINRESEFNSLNESQFTNEDYNYLKNEGYLDKKPLDELNIDFSFPWFNYDYTPEEISNFESTLNFTNSKKTNNLYNVVVSDARLTPLAVGREEKFGKYIYDKFIPINSNELQTFKNGIFYSRGLPKIKSINSIAKFKVHTIICLMTISDYINENNNKKIDKFFEMALRSGISFYIAFTR